MSGNSATGTLSGLSNGSLTFGPPDSGLVLTLAPFYKGDQGEKGDPGIIVSPTPPLNPQINDLWLQIPGP